MGIRASSLFLLERAIGRPLVECKGLRICELGNQHLKWDDKNLSRWMSDRGIQDAEKLKTGKELFVKMGWEHTSVDLNGLDGALPLDLCHVIEEDELPLGFYDVVTNFGTSEHVPDQHHCFLNIHNLCRSGGVMVHVVSADQSHGAYNYDLLFFSKMALECDYATPIEHELIEISGRGRTVRAALIKTISSEFPNRISFTPWSPIRVNDFDKYQTLWAKGGMSC